ncbi:MULTISPECIES: hypothetical protein [unclassified Endozoicomonas]|uniref:hypothetical protein n=1 Tax=unclassified Endozoicomonas TaxID=2644528 RepID=UPI00214944E9|nr:MULTISPECIES: hypothetical protein [unclassified Endozoicomonas]
MAIGKASRRGIVAGCRFDGRDMYLLISPAPGQPCLWHRANDVQPLLDIRRRQEIRQHYPLLAEQFLEEER